MAEPWPEAWQDIVHRNVPLVRRLGPEARRRLEGLVQIFLDEKHFEGIGGQEITHEVRLTIAAQACLLLVGLDGHAPYPDLKVIRVYPSTYRATAETRVADVVSEHDQHRLGQSSRHGYVVLAWDATRMGARKPHDGHNVVLHEFAHQLDTEDGVADGAPLLHSAAAYGPWARALGEAFEELEEDVAARRKSVLDAYGAKNPAEFFAVATETFFEQPRALQRAEPALYEVLVKYYRQQPAD